jgi:hypothetical protein
MVSTPRKGIPICKVYRNTHGDIITCFKKPGANVYEDVPLTSLIRLLMDPEAVETQKHVHRQ